MHKIIEGKNLMSIKYKYGKPLATFTKQNSRCSIENFQKLYQHNQKL